MDTAHVQKQVRNDLLVITEYIKKLDTFDPTDDGIGSARHALETYDFVGLLDDKLHYMGAVGAWGVVSSHMDAPFELPNGRIIPQPEVITWLQGTYERHKQRETQIADVEATLKQNNRARASSRG